MVRYWQWKKGWLFASESNQVLNSFIRSLCDYSDAYILIRVDITVTGGNVDTEVAFKNCASLKKRRSEINDTFADKADCINIAMPMYNFIEYSDNYSDTSGSLWQFKRDEIVTNKNVCNSNSSSFKYISQALLVM